MMVYKKLMPVPDELREPVDIESYEPVYNCITRERILAFRDALLAKANEDAVILRPPVYPYWMKDKVPD